MTTTIGADPEVFLKRGNEFVSAIGKLGGSKNEPYKLPGKKGYAVLEDNVAAEYNIPAATKVDDFVDSNLYMLDWLSKKAKEYDCELALGVPSAVFSDVQLDHPLAHHFGCDPDFDAWKLRINPKPHSENPNLRSCGGHIHIGCPEFSLRQKIQLIRLLDLTVGQALAALEPENERAKLYGRPGAMRNKPYGVEWRTPSNYWLTSKELMASVVSTVPNIVAMIKADAHPIKGDYDNVAKVFESKSPDLGVIKLAMRKGLLDTYLGELVIAKCGTDLDKAGGPNKILDEVIKEFTEMVGQ